MPILLSLKASLLRAEAEPDPALAAFLQGCEATIRPGWSRAATARLALLTAPPEYAAEVVAAVGDDGRIWRFTLRERSGDRAFDEAALGAIQRVISLPSPPPEWLEAAREGVVFRFQAKNGDWSKKRAPLMPPRDDTEH